MSRKTLRKKKVALFLATKSAKMRIKPDNEPQLDELLFISTTKASRIYQTDSNFLFTLSPEPLRALTQDVSQRLYLGIDALCCIQSVE